MSRTSVLSVVAVLLSSGCAAAPRVDVAAEQRAVTEVSARWLELEKARDAAGIAGLFADEGVIYRANAEPVVGRAAIESYLAKDFADEPEESVSWSTDRVEVAASGDVAVEQGSWTATGTQEGTDNGWYLTTYRKVNDRWLVTADMSISTRAKPAAPPAQAAAAQPGN